MTKRRFAVYDVFSSDKLAGNPLAVVFDSEGLNDAGMQAIAREFNLSETTFILPPTDPRHRAHVRIFTPMHELPFAGHPTVGSAIAITESSGDDAPSIFVLEEKVGPVRCAVSKDDKGLFAEFDLPRLPEPVSFAADPAAIAAALGLGPQEIGFENHVVTQYSGGVPYVLVPVAGLGAAGRASLDTRAWMELTGPAEALSPGAFVYCRETVHHGNAFHARMFAGHVGIPEDPATGSAVAAFAGAIMRFEKPGDGVWPYPIEQGVEMGRASLIRLELDVEGGALVGARIGGHAVKVSEGNLLVS
ncbi:PhzF family phenazine biosynthesis protein [Mesorhizobium sp. BAC0120]|uniref:PhzF family phenazine biosynthesis protein n=1 Tax=Mesorhizobium sp. BAC0120 TaxID=3090670 RepID=UPI00298C23E1|nr:PhzF family phenazine biosynthesis protein [Mesorhizobium sp. BAC0120]MDW6020657.1 PhzF family phenazine biosynthesis protein [Mesorhizobium sp. BAC0120]